MPIFNHRSSRDNDPPQDDLDQLLDLPLADAGTEEATPEPAAEGGPPPEERRRRLWPWFVLLFVLAFPAGGLVGYLLRPSPPVAVLSADLLDFGEVRVGSEGEELAVEIRNRGEEVLRIREAAVVGEAAGEFEIRSDACSGREVARETGCALRLGFGPEATGSRRARIELLSNAVNSPGSLALLGRGTTPRLELAPERLEFGSRKLGSASPPARLWLTNTGTAPLAVERVELEGLAAADFVRSADGCSARPLAPGERCSLEYRFVPTAVGERRAEVAVASDAPESPALPWLLGVGLPQEPLLRLEPERLDFGPRPVGERGPAQAVAVRNEGDGALVIERLASGLAEVAPFDGPAARDGAAEPGAGGPPEGGADDRSPSEIGFELIADDCGGRTVPPGEQCTFEIAFRPVEEGRARAFFEIQHSAQGGVHSLPVLGVGTAPHVSLEPLRLSFGEVAVEALSTPRVLRLVNSGTGPLRVRDLGVDGADRGSFSPMASGCAGATLEPGATCAVEVRFRPRREGPHRAELTIRHNADRGRHRLPLNGFGVSARLRVVPERLDFGSVRVTEARELRLEVENRGRAALEVQRLRLSGGGAFELRADRCSGVALDPGETCGASVRFAPDRAGIRDAVLAIDHGGAAGPAEVPITATAAPPPVPELRLDPAGLDFRERRVGERSPILTLRIENPGSGRLVLRSLRLAGESPADFRLVPGSCDGAEFIAPGAGCTVGVRFTPTAEGPRRAELLVRHNAAGGTDRVELRGRGTVPPPPP